MKKNRSVSVDVMRGAALLLMFVNHLGRFFPAMSGVVHFCYGILGITTSAEIFIAISAYAIFRSSQSEQDRFHSAEVLALKAKRRFTKLYFVHVLLLSLVILLSLGSLWTFGGQRIRIDYPATDKFIYGLIFLFQPALFDIIPLYLIFTVLNPVAISLIKKGKYYIGIGLSFLLWFLVQNVPWLRYERFTDTFVLPFFHPLAWQFLYCSLLGIFSCGTYIKSKRQFFSSVSLAVILFLFIYSRWFVTHSIEDYYLTSRQYMGPLRILNILSLSVFMLSFNREISSTNVTKLFEWVGRNSLLLFSIHLLIYHINKFYIFNHAYYWDLVSQLVTYVLLVFLPLPICYIWSLTRNRFAGH